MKQNWPKQIWIVRHGESAGNVARDAAAFAKAHELLYHAHGLGQKVVLASSPSQDDLDHYLDLLRVRDVVIATTSSAEVENTKPAPDIFSRPFRSYREFRPQRRSSSAIHHTTSKLPQNAVSLPFH